MTIDPLQQITDGEVERIRHYLGYPLERTYVDRITARARQIESEFPTALPTLRKYLFEINRCLSQINQNRPFAAETFTSSGAGTRQYRPDLRLQNFKDEARQYIANLSHLIDMPVQRDIFSPRWGSASTIRG